MFGSNLALPKIIDWHDTISAALSKQIDLTCRTKANPIANVTWYHTSEKNISNFRTSDMDYSFITFSKLKKKDGGKYICRAENIHGVVQKEVVLIVAGIVFSYSNL